MILCIVCLPGNSRKLFVTAVQIFVSPHCNCYYIKLSKILFGGQLLDWFYIEETLNYNMKCLYLSFNFEITNKDDNQNQWWR